MENSEQSKITGTQQANLKEDDTILITSSYTLRKTIGILGMALPLLLFTFQYFYSGLNHPLESISHYYYTRVSGLFVATLSILAIFLIIYKGKELLDLIFSSVAGVAALFVVFFPTGNIVKDCCVTLCTCSGQSHVINVSMLPQDGFRENLHFISAGIFLICLAYMSIFLFTKSDKPPKERGLKKIIRNRIYRVCGILMLTAIAIIFMGGFLGWIPDDFYVNHHLTYWMETMAIESFGFSWLIKGEALLKD